MNREISDILCVLISDEQMESAKSIRLLLETNSTHLPGG
jgi:hypothetical protein